MNLNIAWKRFLIEAVVIVSSILLAFSIQAWWDGKREREIEQVMLRSLLNDFTLKQETLEDYRHFNEAIVESATALLNEFAEPSLPLVNTEVDFHIANIMWFNREPKWRSAPLDSLMIGGNISLISNPMLQQDLASIQLSLDEIKQLSRSDELFYIDILFPFMMKNGSLPQLRQYWGQRPGLPEQSYEMPNFISSDPYDHNALLSNLEFRNLLVQRISQITDIFNNGYVGFEENLANIISIIEAELE